MITAGCTELPAELVSAYKATDYVAFADAEIRLKIDKRSLQLAKLLSEHSCTAAAFITAFNPYGELLSESDNRQANDRLEAHIEELQLARFNGEGRGSEGDWPPEPSFLVLGLNRKDASSLGRTYRQNAIVWTGADAIPELVLLR